MRVFLTGATGYVGTAVAAALRAAGHQVIGLARSDEAAQQLETRGDTVQRGDLTATPLLGAAAAEADAVIHTAMANTPEAGRIDRLAVEAMLGALAGSNKPFVYTSGIWVLGDTGDRVADETTPPDPTPLVAWRVPVEALVREAAARAIRTVVLRPGVVYGGAEGIVGELLRTGRSQGVVRYVGTGRNRWPLVHADDLAEGYRLAMERATAGSLYLLAHGPSVPVGEVARMASDAAGLATPPESWPLESARERLGAYADALVLDQQVSAERAVRELDWAPSAPDLATALAEAAREL